MLLIITKSLFPSNWLVVKKMISIIQIIRWNSCWNYGMQLDHVQFHESSTVRVSALFSDTPTCSWHKSTNTTGHQCCFLREKTVSRFPHENVANKFWRGFSSPSTNSGKTWKALESTGKHWNLSQLSHEFLVDFRQNQGPIYWGEWPQIEERIGAKNRHPLPRCIPLWQGENFEHFWTIPYHTHVHFG